MFTELLFELDKSEIIIEPLRNLNNYPVLTKDRNYIYPLDELRMLVGQRLITIGLNNFFYIQQEVIQTNLVRDHFGKPFLKDYPDVNFNVSHSGVYVGCVFSTMRVGLDIQKVIKLDTATLADKFFAPEEKAYLQQSTAYKIEFTRLWTRKEALCKALGTGLNETLLQMSVLNDLVDEHHLKSQQLADSYWQSICSKGVLQPIKLYKMSQSDLLSGKLPTTYNTVEY
ncbi:4'-phosphopantetheinyl transferase family protein [Bombilactobacillus thymidiniphilus]|uniref:4'-phosphopantetheinyl transferase superfamily protein n=1 Tax=Bombilactobacillus thymidiniphilus TaxID=2923363 RepID=A0ABY4PDB1_9LACO|nr:4'-phosphopantetheinyl transferase superfamily protein [Bombilactobacillus thymidiniphilus]UQS83663.1 4'-phosphopantetheinyl transferase superfamily protein [Bombilactobacillus thymidiniphilus]